MNTQQTVPAYRAISILTLIQAGVIVAGTLLVGVMCKYKGYGSGQVPDWFFRSDALFVRNFGWTLLLIPASWAALTIFVARIESKAWLQTVLIGIGIASVLFGAYYFFVLALNTTIL